MGAVPLDARALHLPRSARDTLQKGEGSWLKNTVRTHICACCTLLQASRRCCYLTVSAAVAGLKGTLPVNRGMLHDMPSTDRSCLHVCRRFRSC